MTFETEVDDDHLPDEVEQHDPGIFRIDVEALFGHIDDPNERYEHVTDYAVELHDQLPGGSIILPMEVEKISATTNPDELVTREEMEDAIAEARRETAEELRAEIQAELSAHGLL